MCGEGMTSQLLPQVLPRDPQQRRRLCLVAVGQRQRPRQVRLLVAADRLVQWEQLVARLIRMGSRGSELQALPLAARSREARAGTILEAHRLLAEAERANETRFEDVLEFLKTDLPDSIAGRFKN